MTSVSVLHGPFVLRSPPSAASFWQGAAAVCSDAQAPVWEAVMQASNSVCVAVWHAVLLHASFSQIRSPAKGAAHVVLPSVSWMHPGKFVNAFIWLS